MSGLQDAFLDIEGDAVALFKLAVIETQNVDDVQAIAEAWRLMADGYARILERSEESRQRFEKGKQAYERLAMTAVLPSHFDHLMRCLKRLQARCLELYALHA